MLTKNHIANIDEFLEGSNYIKLYIDRYLLTRLKDLSFEQGNELLIEELERLHSMKKWYFYRLIEELYSKGAKIPSKYSVEKSIEKDIDEENLLGDIPKNFMYNKRILFTGALENFKRREIKALVEKMGGIPASSVNESLDYLIVGNKPGSKLKKAKGFDAIRIIDEKEFIEMLKKYDESEEDKIESNHIVEESFNSSKEVLPNNITIDRPLTEERMIIKDIQGARGHLEENQCTWHEKVDIMKKFNISEEDLKTEEFQDYLVTEKGVIYWDYLNLTLQEEVSLIDNISDIMKMDYNEFKVNYSEFINRNKELITIERCRGIANALVRERG